MEQEVRNTIDLIEANSIFTIETEPMLNCRFKIAKTIQIMMKTDEWNYRNLSVFINEAKYLRYDPKNGARYQFNQKRKHYYFFRFIKNTDSEQFVLVNIDDNISLRVSKKYLTSWSSDETVKSKTIKYLNIDLTGSSQALLKGEPLLYYLYSDFSSLFHSFTATFCEMKVAKYSKKKKKTMHFYDYIQSFRSENITEAVNFERFCNMLKGFLHLNVAEHNNTSKRLDKFEQDGKNYYVLNGVYINPYAGYLIQKTETAGIMLDTTWKLLQHYVVSIPEVIIHNVGLPLGYSFGLVEDSEIYNIIFDFFEKTFHFKITDYVLNAESDQGTGLRKSIKNHNMKHLKCLRHLLVSHDKGCFSEQIGNLVSVTSKLDFKELKKQYNNSWSEITYPKMISKLEKNLNKVVLHL